VKELFPFIPALRLRAVSALLLLPLLLTLLSGPASGAGEELRCAQCGAPIRPGERYLRSGALAFCSNACMDAYWRKSLPKCAVCGAPVSNGFKKDGKVYCSESCLSTTWPKCVVCGLKTPKGILVNGEAGKFVCEACSQKPRCFDCGMPGDGRRRLPDGRFLCEACFMASVADIDDALRVFDSVRKGMRGSLGLSTSHRINLSLVGLDKLEKMSGKSGEGTEYGLFEYTATVETMSAPGAGSAKRVSDEAWSVYALYGLSPDKLAEVLSHELAHDWMQTCYPGIKDARVKEGWAEYVSWRMNALSGRQALNKRIELNQDPVYGAGFRFIRQKAEKDGMEGLKAFFRRLSNSGGAE